MGGDGIARIDTGMEWRSPPGEKEDISSLAETMTAGASTHFHFDHQNYVALMNEGRQLS